MKSYIHASMLSINMYVFCYYTRPKGLHKVNSVKRTTNLSSAVKFKKLVIMYVQLCT